MVISHRILNKQNLWTNRKCKTLLNKATITSYQEKNVKRNIFLDHTIWSFFFFEKAWLKEWPHEKCCWVRSSVCNTSHVMVIQRAEITLGRNGIYNQKLAISTKHCYLWTHNIFYRVMVVWLQKKNNKKLHTKL